MHLSTSLDVDAPPDVVWSVWRDLERWPEWTASITSVERLTPGELAVGLRARVRQPKLPSAVWHVTALDEGQGPSSAKYYTWVAKSPGVHVTATHRVEPRNGGSRVTASIEFAGFLGRLIGRGTRELSERYLQMEANGLKARSEMLAAK